MEGDFFKEKLIKINILIEHPMDKKEAINRVKKTIKEYLSRSYSGNKFILDIRINNKPLDVLYVSRHNIRNRIMKEIFIKELIKIKENERAIRYINKNSDWGRYLSKESFEILQSICETEMSIFGKIKNKLWYKLSSADFCYNYSE